MHIFKNKYSKSILSAAIAVLMTAALAQPAFALGQGDAYRVIQVYQLDGTADVTRPGTGSMKPYKNMALLSGDSVSTHKSSWLYMKVDDDKYIMAEPLTDFDLEATGSKKKSTTRINLKKGAVVNRVDEKLGADSLYEVNTPNSTMAIRGTEFRVEVIPKQDGTTETEINVFEGTVAVSPHRADGTPTGETLMLGSGQEIVVWSDAAESGFGVAPAGINYQALTRSELEFLSKSSNEGRILSITREQLDELLKRGGTVQTGNGDELAGAAVMIVPVRIPADGSSADSGSGGDSGGDGSGSDAGNNPPAANAPAATPPASAPSTSTGAMAEAGDAAEAPNAADTEEPAP